MHRNSTVTGPPKGKPKFILFYNKTKVGVDAMDQMINEYSTKTASRRCTFAVFCNTLDKSVINSWIIYRKITQTKISRRDFVYELFIELTSMYNPEQNQSLTRATDEPSAPATSNNQLTPLSVAETRHHCQTSGCQSKRSLRCSKCEKFKRSNCCDYLCEICHGNV